jgi:hypothetical protein
MKPFGLAILFHSATLVIGKGSIETSYGVSKFFSAGSFWDYDYPQRPQFGGIAFHIGKGESTPITVSFS